MEGEEAKEDGPVWGESFKVEWIKTERLPFYRSRHLRNLWNHDREVKVSRDGTELEPGVGQALLEEWDKPDPGPPAGPAAAAIGCEVLAGRQGSGGAAGRDGMRGPSRHMGLRRYCAHMIFHDMTRPCS